VAGGRSTEETMRKSALAIQCLPLSASTREEAYALVDRAIAVIDGSGLSYTVGPFETVVEGELDRLWEVARSAHRAILEADASGAGRVATYIKLFSGPELGSSEEKTGKYRRRGH
jgi:uncharacterized protein YqgV (UPF0045/DUF77 family)